MSAALDILSWVFLVAGSAFCIIGGIGLIRMPDFYTRVHAASVTDTLGAGLMLLGLMIQAGLTLACAKLIMIGVLILFMSPTATHALTRAALVRGLEPVLADEGGGQSKRL